MTRQLGPSLDLVVGERLRGWRVRFSRQKGVRRGLAICGSLLLAGLVGPRLDRRAMHQRARLVLELVIDAGCVLVATSLHDPPAPNCVAFGDAPFPSDDCELRSQSNRSYRSPTRAPRKKSSVEWFQGRER